MECQRNLVESLSFLSWKFQVREDFFEDDDTSFSSIILELQSKLELFYNDYLITIPSVNIQCIINLKQIRLFTKMILMMNNVKNSLVKNRNYRKSKKVFFLSASIDRFGISSLAARRIGTLLTKVAANRHFQRFAALKPVAGVIEKLSNAEIGANIELTNISGMMTVMLFSYHFNSISFFVRLIFHHHPVIVYGKNTKQRNGNAFMFIFSRRVGFAEMPDLNLIVTPVFGESQYSYTLIHELLEARIRDEIKVIFRTKFSLSQS